MARRSPPRYRRGPGVVCVAGEGTLLVVRGDGAAFDLGGDEAVLASRILMRLLDGSATAAALADELDAAAPALLSRLADAGIVRAEAEDAPAAVESRPPPCAHVVLGVCGAVQALDVAPFVLALQRGFGKAVDVVLTRGAQHFVKPEALAVLGVDVWTDEFAARGPVRVPHMHLAERAGVVLVLPASAHSIMRLATGACSDLLSLVVAATSAPVVLAPAMNGAMWRNPAIARNVRRLREDGMFIIEPVTGVALSDGATKRGGVGVRPGELMAVLTGLFARRAALTPPKSGAASGRPRPRRR